MEFKCDYVYDGYEDLLERILRAYYRRPINDPDDMLTIDNSFWTFNQDNLTVLEEIFEDVS